MKRTLSRYYEILKNVDFEMDPGFKNDICRDIMKDMLSLETAGEVNIFNDLCQVEVTYITEKNPKGDQIRLFISKGLDEDSIVELNFPMDVLKDTDKELLEEFSNKCINRDEFFINQKEYAPVEADMGSYSVKGALMMSLLRNYSFQTEYEQGNPINLPEEEYNDVISVKSTYCPMIQVMNEPEYYVGKIDGKDVFNSVQESLLFEKNGDNYNIYTIRDIGPSPFGDEEMDNKNAQKQEIVSKITIDRESLGQISEICDKLQRNHIYFMDFADAEKQQVMLSARPLNSINEYNRIMDFDDNAVFVEYLSSFPIPEEGDRLDYECINGLMAKEDTMLDELLDQIDLFESKVQNGLINCYISPQNAELFEEDYAQIILHDEEQLSKDRDKFSDFCANRYPQIVKKYKEMSNSERLESLQTIQGLADLEFNKYNNVEKAIVQAMNEVNKESKENEKSEEVVDGEQLLKEDFEEFTKQQSDSEYEEEIDEQEYGDEEYEDEKEIDSDNENTSNTEIEEFEYNGSKDKEDIDESTEDIEEIEVVEEDEQYAGVMSNIISGQVKTNIDEEHQKAEKKWKNPADDMPAIM